MTIDDLPPITPDPVIEAFKRDVDRTLLRRALRMSPADRLREMDRFMKQVARSGAANPMGRAGARTDG